jgi:pimeloyl-ACP methyl ester carboxylesterase
MSEAITCQNPGTSTCPAAAPLSLASILQRFQREAVHGVCDTGRYRCPYHVWGSGPPILFIPGLADDALSFVQMSAHLAAHFRCVAFDLPAGQADGAQLSRYTHADLVADVVALLDHLGIEQSYVVGSSFGATIALGALRAQPRRFPRAVVQGGFARRPLTLAERLLVHVARYWPGSLRSLPFRQAGLRRLHYAAFADRPPEEWEFFIERANIHPIPAMAHRALLVHRLDLRPVLAGIRQPVLLVCGDNDHLVSRACEEDLLRGLPNARRIELLNCGHNPLFTHTEVLAEVVRQFLTPP